MTNMMIIFHIIVKMLKNPILKIYLNRFYLNASTCNKILVL